VDLEQVEEELCDMITLKLIFAKIDRLGGVVSFKKPKNENGVLNDWRFDLNKILDLVDHTTNLATREYDVIVQKA